MRQSASQSLSKKDGAVKTATFFSERFREADWRKFQKKEAACRPPWLTDGIDGHGLCTLIFSVVQTDRRRLVVGRQFPLASRRVRPLSPWGSNNLLHLSSSNIHVRVPTTLRPSCKVNGLNVVPNASSVIRQVLCMVCCRGGQLVIRRNFSQCVQLNQSDCLLWHPTEV